MNNKWKTYCPLPFMAVDPYRATFAPCCHIDRNNFKKYTNIDDYYKSTELHNLKNNLKNGVRDPMCQHCWTNEDRGLKSLRQSVIKEKSRRADETKIRQIKLRVGHTCNLACMMCFSTVSSTWNKLWNEKLPENVISPEKENYDEITENYIKKNLKNIEFIETLGGEPLFSKKFLNLLEWIVTQGNAKHITLYIVTNLTILTPKILNLLKFFKKIVITVSLEGVGLVNDYIRWGSDFKNIDANLKKSLQNNFDVCILSTVSSLNLHRLHEIYDYAESIGVPVMTVNEVERWKSLSVKNLPKYLHNKVHPKFQKLIEFNGDEKSLKNFIINWDKQRKISILNYMPEFKELLDA